MREGACRPPPLSALLSCLPTSLPAHLPCLPTSPLHPSHAPRTACSAYRMLHAPAIIAPSRLLPSLKTPRLLPPLRRLASHYRLSGLACYQSLRRGGGAVHQVCHVLLRALPHERAALLPLGRTAHQMGARCAHEYTYTHCTHCIHHVHVHVCMVALLKTVIGAVPDHTASTWCTRATCRACPMHTTTTQPTYPTHPPAAGAAVMSERIYWRYAPSPLRQPFTPNPNARNDRASLAHWLPLSDPCTLPTTS